MEDYLVLRERYSPDYVEHKLIPENIYRCQVNVHL